MRSTGSFCVTDDDLAACADLVRQADPERFRAAMASPVAARRVLFPLYAFNVEVARAPWMTEEPMIAQMRLQWWREVLEEISAGGPVRRHMVATPLAELLDGEAARLLDDLIVARFWDIGTDPFADEAALDTYLTHTAGHLMWVAARLLGAGDPAPLLARGHAHGLANWLRAVPLLKAAGRIPLLDERSEAIRALAQRGLARLDEARRAKLPKSARAALLPAWQTELILRRARAEPARVMQGELDVSPLRSRLMLMMRATVAFR